MSERLVNILKEDLCLFYLPESKTNAAHIFLSIHEESLNLLERKSSHNRGSGLFKVNLRNYWRDTDQ